MGVKRTKRVAFILLVVVFSLVATGCSIKEVVKTESVITPAQTADWSYNVGVDAGSFAIYAEMWEMTSAELRQTLVNEGYTVTNETINDEIYVIWGKSGTGASFSDLERIYGDEIGYDRVYISDKMFYVYCKLGQDQYENMSLSGMGDLNQMSAPDEDMQVSVYQKLSVTFAVPVVSTNGVIDAENPNHVTWENANLQESMAFYASTAAVSETARTTSVKNNKRYKKDITINVSGAESLCRMTLNGKQIKPGKVVKKSGEYELIIWSLDGQAQQVNFIIDKKKPTIRGAKNGKTYKKPVTLYFEDQYFVNNSYSDYGLASVKVNGKKISKKKYNGYTIKKNGKYKVVATDKAGNKKTITFWIKKK